MLKWWLGSVATFQQSDCTNNYSAFTARLPSRFRLQHISLHFTLLTGAHNQREWGISAVLYSPTTLLLKCLTLINIKLQCIFKKKSPCTQTKQNWIENIVINLTTSALETRCPRIQTCCKIIAQSDKAQQHIQTQIQKNRQSSAEQDLDTLAATVCDSSSLRSWLGAQSTPISFYWDGQGMTHSTLQALIGQ